MGSLAATYVVSPPHSRSWTALQARKAIYFPAKKHARCRGVMTCVIAAANGIVTLKYEQLLDKKANLGDEISRAFGEGGLGLLTVAEVPGYAEQRAALLPLAQRLACLPDDTLARLEDPESHFSFGWSCGKETLQDGRPDYFKGSFYANPTTDLISHDKFLMSAHPSYCRPNIWPVRDLPELELAFKVLGSNFIHVGTLLAYWCDQHVAEKLGAATNGTDFTLQERLISTSRNSKGRLLHYFPPSSRRVAALRREKSNSGDPASQGAYADDAGAPEAWCGWHTDHGSLTGLAGAMFLDETGAEVANPDPERAGLYVRTRKGEVVRVVIPQGHMAFQVGEAMQVHSGGLLQATPHYVAAPQGSTVASVSRNTFAVFMQPRWDEPMEPPRAVQKGGPDRLRRVGVGQWREGLSFGEFTNLTLNKYYG